MTRNYKLLIKTPQGKCDIEADSWDDLMLLAPEAVSKVLSPSGRKLGLDATAKVVLQAVREYKKRKSLRPNNVPRTPYAGHELEVIKCYLQGMTIAETKKWLKQNRDVECSESSVGRCWLSLGEIKAACMFRRQ
jgi:hypothetical protein